MTVDQHIYAGLLYSQPTFNKGVARTLDIWGTFDSYNYSQTPQEADRAAIASDWYAVGADLHRSISKITSSNRESPRHGRNTKSK